WPPDSWLQSRPTHRAVQRISSGFSSHASASSYCMTGRFNGSLRLGSFMARIVVIFSLCLAACDVGQLPGATGDGGGSGTVDSGNGCEPIATTIPTGHHPEGHESKTMGCMSAAGCHNQALGLGPAAPAYSIGGLLFK